MRTSMTVLGWVLPIVAAGAVACSSTSTDVTPSTDGGHDGATGGDGGSTSVSASSFKQTCAVDNDCVAVLDGDQCAVCRCPSAAVAKSDEAAFHSAAKAAADNCSPQQPAIGCGVDCASPNTACVNGTCGFRPFGVVDASTDAPDAG